MCTVLPVLCWTPLLGLSFSLSCLLSRSAASVPCAAAALEPMFALLEMSPFSFQKIAVPELRFQVVKTCM